MLPMTGNAAVRGRPPDTNTAAIWRAVTLSRRLLGAGTHPRSAPLPGRNEDPMAMEASLLLAEAPPSAGSLLLARGCGCRSGLSILCTSVCPLAGEVVFGPGVQLQPKEGHIGDPTLGDISDMVTRMDIDPMCDRDGAIAAASSGSSPHKPPLRQGETGTEAARDIYSGLFRELEGPILQAPPQLVPSTPVTKTRAKKKTTLPATRTSLRQAARPSNIPVAERATLKLMRELEFVSSQQQQAPDAAVASYIDLYADDLPEMAVQAIRAATRVGNKKLIKALEAIVQEADAVEMEA